jgi:hypothetical protein
MCNRILPCVALVCCTFVAATGCKKKEEPKKPEAAAAAAGAAPVEAAQAPDKPAAPALPDVELAAGDGIAAWLSMQSIGGVFDAADVIGGKMQVMPPGGSLRDGAYAQMATMLAVAGITGHEWLDKTKPVHVAFQDDGSPAPAAPTAPGARPVALPPTPPDPTGTFVILHVTDKAKTLAAMPTAKKGPDAEGHEAAITVEGKTAYLDFVGDTTLVLTTSKDRFAKVKAFVERIDKVVVPSLLYLGVSLEDVAKTRAHELDQFFGMLTEMGKNMPANPAMPNQATVMDVYAKMLKKWATEMTRIEVLVGADVNAFNFEVRIAAKDGSSLQRQLQAGRGRTTRDIAGLLPGNTYLSFAQNMDPQSSIGSLDENLVALKDLLRLEQKDWDAFVADLKAVVNLQDGQAAFGAYPDGTAALGMSFVYGTSDGETSLRVGKKLVADLLLKVIAMQKAQQALAPDSKEAKMLGIVEEALKQQKLDPVLQSFGPMAKEAGVTLTANTVKDGETSCDVLDVTIDYAKMPPGESAQVKAVIGDKTALALCASKARISFAVGPGALEHGKRAALGTAGGLSDQPIYKASTAKGEFASAAMYVNPGMALSAFKALGPEVPQLPGDKAATLLCHSRARSYGCTFEVPIDLMVAVKQAMSAPAAPPAGIAVPPGAAPGTVAPGAATP